MATGLLICCTGKATKQVESLMGQEKVYDVTLRLGQSTASYDLETPVIRERPWQEVDIAKINELRPHFEGEIMQRPPLYSALWQDGERLYEKARRGEVVDIPARSVQVHELIFQGLEGPELRFIVRCSKGTYVRSLAHDMGERLGCGAHLIALRRVSSGSHHVKDAWKLADMQMEMQARIQRETCQGGDLFIRSAP